MRTVKVLRIVACLLALGVSWPTTAASDSRDDRALMRGDFWDMWMAATHHQCPGNQLEWVGLSDSAVDLVDGFDATLPHADRERVTSIADYSNRCRQEIGGFTCYLAVHVDAFKRLGLLNRFAKFGCKNYDCYKEAAC